MLEPRRVLSSLAAIAPAASIALWAIACSPNPPTPGAAPAQAAPATQVPPPPPAERAPRGEDACAQAALTLTPESVVATVNGESITIAELGDDLKKAEAEALRAYCNAVSDAREGLLRNAIDRRLLEAAAKAEGKEVQGYLEAKVQAAVGTPSDAEIEAFYNEHKSPDAPPLDLVRDQVAAALSEEKTNTALTSIVEAARKGATISQHLPDVRPPAFTMATSDENPSVGPADAAVEVVEFSDFECPYCSRAANTLSALKTRYPDKVRFVFRHFPLSFHPKARPAAEHAQCAQEQGKFWAFHDLVFAAQRELSVDKLGDLATQAGVDRQKLDECLASGRAGARVDGDLKLGSEVGVGGTPSFYINGRAFTGNPSVEGLSQAIDAELAKAGA
ncbi:MAG: thioredoxin domain-containing protein [Nannocystaceae bacterium]